MRKNAFVFAVAVAFTLAAGAAAKKSDAKTSGPTPDKALLQKLLDGWNTMDPANVAQYYEQGPHTFFDIAPLKYSSWDEYASGVKKLLADYKTFKLTLNDDADVCFDIVDSLELREFEVRNPCRLDQLLQLELAVPRGENDIRV